MLLPRSCRPLSWRLRTFKVLRRTAQDTPPLYVCGFRRSCNELRTAAAYLFQRNRRQPRQSSLATTRGVSGDAVLRLLREYGGEFRIELIVLRGAPVIKRHSSAPAVVACEGLPQCCH